MWVEGCEGCVCYLQRKPFALWKCFKSTGSRDESQKYSIDATFRRIPLRTPVRSPLSPVSPFSFAQPSIYSAAVTALATHVSASCHPPTPTPSPRPRRISLTVNAQLAVPDHLLDLALLLQVVQRLPCQAAIDLQPIHERGDRDEAVGLHVFVEFVRGGFVEDDGVVGLVLDCWLKEDGISEKNL